MLANKKIEKLKNTRKCKKIKKVQEKPKNIWKELKNS